MVNTKKYIMIKRFIIFLGLIIIPLCSVAQFILVPGGFTTVDKKDYVVIEHPGSKVELYNKLRSSLTSTFVSAKDVMSEMEPDLISLHGITSGIYFKHSNLQCRPEIHYKMNIYFKDGRIRFNTPQIIGEIGDEVAPLASYTIFAKKANMFDTTIRIFKKNGTPRLPQGIKAIENYFNNLVNELVRNLDNNGLSEDDNW